MPDESPLVPVFMPPLALVLAASERKRGSPIDQAEATALRDQAHCIMMTAEDAARMSDSRDFRDINPENLWVEWHRLRPQLTGGYLPKIILCVPGGDGLQSACEPILRAAVVEHEFRPHDPKLARAFRAGAMTRQSLTEDDLARIDSHTTVLYALSKNFTPADAADTARTMLSLGRQLLEAGGLAIKCESSCIANPPSDWAALDDYAGRGVSEKWTALFRAFVLHPIGRDHLYTCGMHLLGAPDLIVAERLLRATTPADSNTATTAIRLFASFGIYLLDECPSGTFAPGHTFSMSRDAPRFRMQWEPCEGYAEDDFFFNPFGRWRFTEV